jgi:putative addiction module component (TIGR02574 family)
MCRLGCRCYDSFMTKNADRLLEEALKLPASERAKLAAELLSSLEDRDEDVKAAWAAEIARRAADADVDPDDEEDWRAALDDIRREVLSR